MIGPAGTCDNTTRVKARTQSWLLSVYNSNHISKAIYNRVRHTGSQHLRMYGMPNVHKKVYHLDQPSL